MQHDALIVTAVHFQAQDDFPVVGEFQGVVEQVVQDLADAGDIAAEPFGHRRINQCKQLQALGLSRATVALDHLFYQLQGAEGIEFQLQLTRLDP